MAKLDPITIDSIFDGITPTYFFGKDGSYQSAVAVDPNEQVDTDNFRLSGILYPVGHSKFSGSEVVGRPNFIIRNPKNTHVYAVAVKNSTDANLHSFTDDLSMRSSDANSNSFPLAVSNSLANGAAYYNNYIYIANDDDISRYGPLDNATAQAGQGGEHDLRLETDWWTNDGSFLSVSSPQQTELNNTTYPATGNWEIPNHPMHVHEDTLYIGDVQGGKGVIHSVRTYATLFYDNKSANFTAGETVTGNTSGATATIIEARNGLTFGELAISDVQGTFVDNENITDSDSGDATSNIPDGIVEGYAGSTSEFNDLDLPYGFFPTSIESYGTDLVIAAVQSTDTTSNQGAGALFFWDTVSNSFYRRVDIHDPIVSALINHNGILYGWSGTVDNGYRMWEYLGGNTVKTLVNIDHGNMPQPGAVDAYKDRILWGSSMDSPVERGIVYAWGLEDGRLPKGLHCVAESSDTSSNIAVNSIAITRFTAKTSHLSTKLIIGWDQLNGSGLDKPDTGAILTSMWRSPTVSVGQEFKINKITVPLTEAIAANHEVTPKIFVDNGSSSETLTVLNSTNYTDSERVVPLYPTIKGNTDMFIEFTWGGTAALPIALPITIELETINT